MFPPLPSPYGSLFQIRIAMATRVKRCSSDEVTRCCGPCGKEHVLGDVDVQHLSSVTRWRRSVTSSFLLCVAGVGAMRGLPALPAITAPSGRRRTPVRRCRGGVWRRRIHKLLVMRRCKRRPVVATVASRAWSRGMRMKLSSRSPSMHLPASPATAIMDVTISSARKKNRWSLLLGVDFFNSIIYLVGWALE